MELELELELKITELELELNWKNGIDPNPGVVSILDCGVGIAHGDLDSYLCTC